MKPTEDPLAHRISLIRGHRVLLDSDLAQIYEVSTKAFNQTIARNKNRFPPDFVFQLTEEEFQGLKRPGLLRSQFVTLKQGGRGKHRKYRPWAFTEHGAIMTASLLRSPKAMAMSVYVVRAFIQMREALTTNAVILRRLAEIDKKLVTHDVVLRDIYEKLRPMLNPPPPPPRKEMGFHTGMVRKQG